MPKGNDLQLAPLQASKEVGSLSLNSHSERRRADSAPAAPIVSSRNFRLAEIYAKRGTRNPPPSGHSERWFSREVPSARDRLRE